MDKECSKLDEINALSRFGVTHKTWKRWISRSNFSYDKYLSNSEKKKLINDHENKKRNDTSFSAMHCVQNFFKSHAYRNNVAYIDMLKGDNYWFWREHFFKIFTLDNINSQDETSKDNIRWWKRQINEEHNYDSEHSYDFLVNNFDRLHPILDVSTDDEDDEDEEEEEDEEDEEDDEDKDDEEDEEDEEEHHEEEEKQEELELTLDDTPH